MSVTTATLRCATRGDGDVVDLTAGVAQAVRAAEVHDGVAIVFVVGSTAAITTMEYEPGGVADLQALLEELVPRGRDWEHNRRNADTNAHAHLRAAAIGPSQSIPVLDGRLGLGTWQQLVLLDFDDRPRDRTVLIQLLS